MKTKTGEAGKVKETQETNDTKKKSEVKNTEEDKKYIIQRLLILI